MSIHFRRCRQCTGTLVAYAEEASKSTAPPPRQNNTVLVYLVRSFVVSQCNGVDCVGKGLKEMIKGLRRQQGMSVFVGARTEYGDSEERQLPSSGHDKRAFVSDSPVPGPLPSPVFAVRCMPGSGWQMQM